MSRTQTFVVNIRVSYYRFEAEISKASRPSVPTVFRPSSVRPNVSYTSNQSQQPRFGAPPSSTLFLPTQLQRAGVRPAVPAPPSSGFSSAAPTQNQGAAIGAAVISNKPVLYLPEKDTKQAPAEVSKTAPPTKKQKVEASTKPSTKSTGNSAAVIKFILVLKYLCWDLNEKFLFRVEVALLFSKPLLQLLAQQQSRLDLLRNPKLLKLKNRKNSSEQLVGLYGRMTPYWTGIQVRFLYF